MQRFREYDFDLLDSQRFARRGNITYSAARVFTKPFGQKRELLCVILALLVDVSPFGLGIRPGIMLNVSGLTKTFMSGRRELAVLDGVSFAVPRGGTAAVVGPSGSGKTTLLGICAGLERPTRGSIVINDMPLDPLTEDERADLRSRWVGFIFQNFQLLPTLTALENVMVPLELKARKEARQEALALLDRVGLGDRLDHYPLQLSGGEQQRVAIARAFINEPLILFADEPTGNLDTDTSRTVTDLIFGLNLEARTTLVLVTHDRELAERTDQILSLRNGRLQ